MRVAGGSQAPALVLAADLAPFAEPLLQGLFGAFELQASAENEYVMKCVMRSFSTLQENVIPYLATLLPVLTQKMQLAASLERIWILLAASSSREGVLILFKGERMQLAASS